MQFPPDERDEAQTVNLIGDFGDAAHGPTPLAVRVVGALQGKSPGARRWHRVGRLPKVEVDPIAGGPYIVDAWTLMPSIYRGDRQPLPGRRHLRPGDVVERAHRLPHRGRSWRPRSRPPTGLSTKLPGGGTAAVAALEVADLHDHETSFNADNMHDLCLPPQPRGAKLAGITIGADLIQDPDGDPNLAQRFRIVPAR